MFFEISYLRLVSKILFYDNNKIRARVILLNKKLWNKKLDYYSRF